MGRRGKRQGSRSILIQILIPMLLVMLAQAGLFVVTMMYGGAVEQLRSNAFDILTERVSNRKNYLQNEMIQRWSNVDEAVEQFQNVIMDFLKEKGASPEELTVSSPLSEELLEKLSEDMILLLRRNGVTGMFLVLEGDGSPDKTGLYLRDMDPKTSPADNSDLLVERGPGSLVRKKGFATDIFWQPRFDFSGSGEITSYDFYQKPFDAALEYQVTDNADLGYWSLPFRMNSNDVDIVTYSVPLLDGDGRPYGVAGVELTADYLRSLLPSGELSEDDKGAYLLAVAQGEEHTFSNVVSSGSAFKQIFGEQKQTVFSTEAAHGCIYPAEKSARVTESAFGCVTYLQLYNSHTPFENDRWAVIGVMRDQDLLSFAHRMERTILAASLASLLIGILGLCMAAGFLTRPIAALVKRLKSSDANQPVRLDKVHITEIDQLTEAVEQLSLRVAESAARLPKIIELTGLSIVAFEFVKSTGRFYLTGDVQRLLGSEPADRENFRRVMEDLENHCLESVQEQGDLRIYSLEREDGRRWIRLKLLEDEEKIIGTLSDITQEIQEKRKIEYERDHDLMTSLLNRRAFYNWLGQLFQCPEKLGVAALIMLDLDNLKYINDTYGHDKGDEYIRCTADIIRRHTPPGAVLSRMSGDEFYIFLYGYSSKEELRCIIESLREGMQHTLFPLPDNPDFKVRASAGVAWYPQDSTIYEQLLKYADFAMYKVKNTVKGEFSEFDKDSYSRDAYLLHGKEDLNRMLDGGLVTYHFQPIVDAHTGEVFGYEALMRSTLEPLPSPDVILNLARSQSKLYQIERMTLFRSLEDFDRFREKTGDRRLFVNSISNQILTPEDVAAFEEEYGEYLHRLVVELTEEEKPDEEMARRKKLICRRWDAQMALDDYGTGYNSEFTLLSLNPDYLKIDMSIVRNIDRDANRQMILQNTLHYARSQGILLIAEGVETWGEMEYLIRSGVHYLQGYYIGLPHPTPGEPIAHVREEIRRIASEAAL